ncbi:hypothetical protein GYMLUDRAFT_511424 [Collybiopsis luxurians FD-317 M1]|nr:hypothetical protein GYMLUDRAFT_511424 [Collybiopsis luxurians FD-317 M1]
MSSNRDLQTDPSTTDLPPPYERYISELKQYRASYQSTTHSQRSSFYFKFSVGSSLTLDRSVLRAQCRNTAGEPLASKLELDEYIGTVDGRLVWGRQGFYSVCRNVRLDGFTLHAECENGLNQVVKSDLDLSRYLYVYNGGLGVKVDADMNTVFTEAPWLKFKGRMMTFV